MMDELLDLIHNILSNLLGKSSSKDKLNKYFGNFFFEKNVLVLTQNVGFKKIKNKQEAFLKKINENKDHISSGHFNKRLTRQKIDSSPSNLRKAKRMMQSKKTSEKNEKKNTVTFLVKN